MYIKHLFAGTWLTFTGDVYMCILTLRYCQRVGTCVRSPAGPTNFFWAKSTSYPLSAWHIVPFMSMLILSS